MNDHIDLGADTCQSFIHGIVYYLIYQMVKPSLRCASDIHARTFSDCLQPLQYLNLTCSVFVAMGNKYKYGTVSKEGERVEKRFVGLRFVTDERICDGKYYADSMKVLRRLLNNPELLMTPPAEIPIDDGVPARKLKIKK